MSFVTKGAEQEIERRRWILEAISIPYRPWGSLRIIHPDRSHSVVISP